MFLIHRFSYSYFFIPNKQSMYIIVPHLRRLELYTESKQSKCGSNRPQSHPWTFPSTSHRVIATRNPSSALDHRLLLLCRQSDECSIIHDAPVSNSFLLQDPLLSSSPFGRPISRIGSPQSQPCQPPEDRRSCARGRSG
jgi:hypothetical protein